uniref:AAA+ ATPase domain-containing protein n=1 Tax=Leersia perrieri TaxID=77586 RepID=A0A0D9UWV3_9ORYZ
MVEVMSTASKGGCGGGGDGDSEWTGRWRAEEVIAGNRESLKALRELVMYPILYAREASVLGLNVLCRPFPLRPPNVLSSDAFSFSQRIAAPWPLWHRKVQFLYINPMLERGRSSCERLLLKHNRRHHRRSSKMLPHVVVVASATRVDAVEPALRRPGRFDLEIEVAVPTAEERFEILKLYTKNLHLGECVDLQYVAASCNGYVGADLQALCREAARHAYDRLSNSSESENMLTIIMEDWESAKSVAKNSVTRGVTKEIPTVSWDDIGGVKDVKKKLKQAVEWPIKHAASFHRLGISPIRGVLLHGPPGCSKTTLAKAAAHAAQASFFSLSGAELYSKYVGEGEALLRRTFQMARLASPSIIFFDEADAIAPKRTGPSGNSSGNATVGERLLSTLLTEMDGLELATGIIVLAATNRPDAIDAALLRPGRFDMVLYVPPPDVEGRHEILRIHTRKMPLGEDVDLWKIAERTELFTGADLEGLCREAGMAALRECLRSERFSCDDIHFQAALRSLRPSLTRAVVDEYSNAATSGPLTRRKH